MLYKFSINTRTEFIYPGAEHGSESRHIIIKSSNSLSTLTAVLQIHGTTNGILLTHDEYLFQ